VILVYAIEHLLYQYHLDLLVFVPFLISKKKINQKQTKEKEFILLSFVETSYANLFISAVLSSSS